MCLCIHEQDRSAHLLDTLIHSSISFVGHMLHAAQHDKFESDSLHVLAPENVQFTVCAIDVVQIEQIRISRTPDALACDFIACMFCAECGPQL